MSLLPKQEQLRQLLDAEQKRIHQILPAYSTEALIALARTRDWSFLTSQQMLDDASPKPIAHDEHSYALGWSKTLQLCFSEVSTTLRSTGPTDSDSSWADAVLLQCGWLAEGELVLAHCESGYMRMQQGSQNDYHVWIASKRMPTEWREREDIAWWTKALSEEYAGEMQELSAEMGHMQQQLSTFVRRWKPSDEVYETTSEIDDYYRRLGTLRVKMMACHFLYPAQISIGGCTVELYREVLAMLIGYALKRLALCRAFVEHYPSYHPSYGLERLLVMPLSTPTLVKALSTMLAVDAAAIQRVVDAYSLGRENVSFHCSAPDMPAPPLLRLDEHHLIWSFTGLLTEPLFFLARELKRCYSYEYHTASHAREDGFRQDLYRLFSDKRFIKSSARVELRGVQGDLTTDVDALIFDRKTGALALFELKSQDPFAYSRQERIRQRDYFYNAGKQIHACMQWLNRNGANALLARLDPKLVKRLKAQKVYIFVLGRYLAHFFDGPPPFDQRAAWGTWPQVLRLSGRKPFGAEDANPMQSLFQRLVRDIPLLSPYPASDVQVIPLGESRVYVYPSFEAYKHQLEAKENA